MNRTILIQVTAPAVAVGLLLFGTCMVSVWYINQLQEATARILSNNVASLRTAQELEIRVRQLRFHSFLYLIDPKPERLNPIDQDHERFEAALREVKMRVRAPEQQACVSAIEAGYQQYHDDLIQQRRQVASWRKPSDIAQLVDSHPLVHIIEPCQELLRLNNDAMLASTQENDRVGRQVHWTVLLIGLLGPISGLIAGYGMARGLSRSIYQMSVRVRDAAQRLDQDVASVSIVADGNIENLDRQLQHVLGRVEEVAERLQRHQREMLRAEQLAAVGQLAASVAHEVRNPLTAVKLLVEAALRPHHQTALTQDDFRIIHGEITRLERTVQNFLDFARLPTLQLAACDLREVVGQAIELVQARARQQQVEITVDSTPEAVPVNADRNQLRTVLVNLFLNALDAMPKGGRLGVRLEHHLEGIRLTVQDSGPGIAPEIMARLFTPFASTKPTGTGLGLSMSRKIVEEHGGSLTGTTAPEGGARFTIVLPVTSREGPRVRRQRTEDRGQKAEAR